MDPETRKVRAFYEEYSFPSYEDCDSLGTLIERARKGIYANLLNAQIRFGARVLDVGCGTGQLVNFLSSSGRFVVGCDLSLNSLSKGMAFRNRSALESATFVQSDLFHLPFRDESFHVVLCNGVLHHTPNPAEGFRKVCAMVKPGGFIVVGLYNRFARSVHNLRRACVSAFRLSADRVKGLFVRRPHGEKKFIWFMDQYQHPLESSHTVDEVLTWFDQNQIRFVNSIPSMTSAGSSDGTGDLFSSRPIGSKTRHILAQLGWVFTHSREGGYFILIGRKSE